MTAGASVGSEYDLVWIEGAQAQVFRRRGQRESIVLSYTGAAEAIGIEGQVQQLLQQAMDPEQLSQMYAGWAAWI